MATIVSFDLGKDEMHIGGVTATIDWREANRTQLTFQFTWYPMLQFSLTNEKLGKLLAYASVLAQNCDQANFRDAERTMRGFLQDWDSSKDE